jgi:hypothetical protein
MCKGTIINFIVVCLFFVNNRKKNMMKFFFQFTNLSYLEYVSNGNLIVCILKYPPLIKLVRHDKSAISTSFIHFNDDSVRYSIKLVTLRHCNVLVSRF